jgi:tight adherence protein B
MDILYYGFALLVFLAAALGIEAAWQWWASSQSAAARRVRRRLSQVSQGKPSGSKSASAEGLLKRRPLSESAKMDAWLKRVPGIHVIEDFLNQGGTDWSVGRFLLYSASSAGLVCVLGLIFLVKTSLLLLLVLAASLLPAAMVWKRRESRLLQLERQLPEAADLISRSLRAGHALPSTLQMLADEMPNPVAAEFRIVSDEINFGLPMADALQNLAKRVPLTDLRYMVVAILIQREAGGNLSEVMSNVSVLVRQRLKLQGDVRSLSAEGRLSAWVLCLLPVIIAGVFMMVNPGYLGRFSDDPAGPELLVAASVLMLVGVLWMRTLIRIRI